jgi:hypothetical protein
MNDKQARISAASEWLMEFSVLWAVFPFLDLLIEGKPMRAAVAVLSIAISFVTGVCGILLVRGEAK